MAQRNDAGWLAVIGTLLYAKSSQIIRTSCSQPRPQAAGYILILAVGTGISVTGALLPAYLSWWWLDKVGHVAGGVTLTLGLLILFSRTATVVSVFLLSILWEAFEWIVGYPFQVTALDITIDLLAGWFGLTLALGITWGRTVDILRRATAEET